MNNDKVNRLIARMEKADADQKKAEKKMQQYKENLKQLNRQQKSLRMKKLNAERAQDRKRAMRLGQVLEDYMGQKIDPDLFLAFLHSYGLAAKYKQEGHYYSQKLPEFYRMWLNDEAVSFESLVSINPLSGSQCINKLKAIISAQEQRKLAIKQKDSATIYNLDILIDRLKKEIMLFPFNP